MSRESIDDRIGAVCVLLIFVALAILFSVRICIASDANSNAARGVELRGAIKDALGRPVAGAEVLLEEAGSVIARSNTGPAGSFLFKSLAPGSYSVVANKQGYQQTLQTVVVSSKKPGTPLVVTMEAKGPLTLKLATERLDRARNDLAPEIGATAYRFDQQAIQKLVTASGRKISLMRYWIPPPFSP